MYGLILRKPQDPTGHQIHIFTFLNLHVCNVLYFIFVKPGLVIASSECFTRLILSLSDLIYECIVSQSPSFIQLFNNIKAALQR